MSHTRVLAAASKPFIDWASLGKVAGVSFVFGVALVTLFALGVVGISMAQGRDIDTPGGRVANRPLGAALAGVCFLVCLAGVAYGLYLIIPQFH